MTHEEIAVALTPFGQVDGGRTRWREGTGLGLPIAKALVELHGGQIEIRSMKGKGTEVAITLPVAQRRLRRQKTPLPTTAMFALRAGKSRIQQIHAA